MEVTPEIYKKYLIEKALRRSYVKRRIVLYLANQGFGYVSEIARSICVTPTNVCGALRGMNGRYVAKDSLISLGVVNEMKVKQDENIRVFSLTDAVGQDAVKICKKFEREVM